MNTKSLTPICMALVVASLCSTIAGWIAQAAYQAVENPAQPIQVFFGFLLLGLFVFPIFLLVAFAYSAPLLVAIWLPAWLFRFRIPWFWTWFLAPLFGALVGFCFILLAQKIHPAYPSTTVQHQMVFALHVGGVVGGIAMFCIGTYYSHVHKSA